MDLDDTLRRLEAAKGDPGALALATIDVVLEAHEPKLAGALEAAAVPHWFDEPLLRAILADAVPDAPDWFEQLTAFTVVERFQAHRGWNVHEVTRLALRQRMFAEHPEWFCTYSERAAAQLESSNPLHAIERVYHLLSCTPETAAVQLRELHRQWRRSGALESLQGLATALDELCASQVLTQRSRAHALMTLGSIREERIGVRQLEEMARQAVDLMVSVDDPLGLLDTSTLLGRALRAQGRLGDAIGAYEQARGQLERWAAHESNELRVAEERAILQQGLGRALADRGQLREALEQFEGCMRTLERLRDLEPHDQLRRRELAVAHTDVGDVLLPTPRVAESERYFLSALAVLQSPEHSSHGTDANEHDVAQLKVRLGDVLLSRGSEDGALQQYESGTAIFERLTASDPDQLAWKAALASVKVRIGNVHLLRGAPDTAEQHYMSARELYRVLTDRDGANPSWKQGLGEMSATFGTLRETQGRLGDAAKEYLEGERLLRELSESDPDVVQWKMSHVASRNALGRLLQIVGEGLDDAQQKLHFLSQAVTQFLAARNSLNELVERDQDNSAWQCSLAWTGRLLAGAIDVLADFTEAGLNVPLDLSAADLRERALNAHLTAATVLKRLTENDPQNTEYRRDYSITAARAAGVLEKMGKREDALMAYRAALNASEFLTAIDATNTRWSDDVSSLREAIARLEATSSDEGPPTPPTPTP